MIPAGNEIGRATDRVIGSKEGTRLIRVRLGGSNYYFACEPDEDPGTAIPVLRQRRSAEASQIAVIGPDGHIRPDSVEYAPLEHFCA